MRKQIFLLLWLQCLVSIAQVIENPVFDRSDVPSMHINKVVITSDTTFVYCTYTAEANSWANISGDTYLMSYPSKEKHKLLSSSGLPIAPEERDFPLNEKCEVLFCFSSISGSDYFDFVESPENRAFNIYGVSLKKRFERKYLESEIKRFADMSSFYDSSGDTLKAIQHKINEVEASKYNYGIKSEIYLLSLYDLKNLYEKYKYNTEVTEIKGTLASIQAEIRNSAQLIFDEVVAQKVRSLIINHEHDKADSVLNIYEKCKQTEEGSFMLNITRSLNGYIKIQTCQDISVIVPYAESGKRAFEYLRIFVNEENARESNCWSILKMYAEIYNYLRDSVIIDIAAFSSRYYKDFRQADLMSYYLVLQNTYQYYFRKNDWNSAANTMLDYYNTAKLEKDTTIRIPISEAFIGSAYLHAKDNKNAEKWLIMSYKDFQSFSNRIQFRAYCELLNDMAYFFNLNGKNEIAYTYALESCESNESHYGVKSKEFIAAKAILADCEMGLNRPIEALRQLEEVVALLDSVPDMDIAVKQSYRDKLNYAYSRSNIKKEFTNNDSIVTENSIIMEAINAYSQGNLQKAISKFYYLLNIYNENIQSVEIANYVLVASSLSNILVSAGQYVEADSMLNNSLKLFQEKKIETILVRGLYEAKGLLYFTIGNIDMALRWYNMAMDLYNGSETKGLPYAMLTSNLSLCHYQKKDYQLAKKMADEAYNICTQFYGENAGNADDRLTIMNNIANIYSKTGELSKAKDVYYNIIMLTSIPQTKALALANLGELYWYYEQNYDKAEKTLIQVRGLDAASYVKEMAELNLQVVHCINKNEIAISEIAQINEDIKNEMAEVFSYFSEAEREDYWTQKSQMLVMLNNIALTSFDNRKVNIMAYDNALYTKSMLLNSGRLLERVAKQASPEIKKDLETMKMLKKALSNKYAHKDSIEQLVENISLYEKKIIGAIPDFGEKLKAEFKSVDDVKAMLSNDEVAIEFVFLPRIKFPFEKSELQYGALMMSKESDAPTLIPLCYENELEYLFDVDNSTSQDYVDNLYNAKDERLYNKIWTKIEPYLSNVKTVYYSPTGYISKINISAISDGTLRLYEKYDIYEVSTTAMISETKQNGKKPVGKAILLGDINYFEDSEMMVENAKKYKYSSSGNLLATRSLDRNTWDLLPGTKDEITCIDELMKSKDVNSHIISQNNASEESFKAMDGNAPDVIHIATHGFYLSQNDDITSSFFGNLNSYTQKDYSMFFSGLLFAGANNVWTGKELANGIEDGILTAEELSRIDLDGCRLVVLSACNTGLGDINNIDGVFGLQRGFKKAGVSTILMSLWKVPDEETNILMQNFYQQYLSGKSAHQSLRLAQEQLIKAGKTPYYWAGFILLD